MVNKFRKKVVFTSLTTFGISFCLCTACASNVCLLFMSIIIGVFCCVIVFLVGLAYLVVYLVGFPPWLLKKSWRQITNWLPLFHIWRMFDYHEQTFYSRNRLDINIRRKTMDGTVPRGRMDRSSHQRCSIKKGVLKSFLKFTEKHLWQSLFFNKVAGLRAQVFSCKFWEIFKNIFFYITPVVAASGWNQLLHQYQHFKSKWDNVLWNADRYLLTLLLLETGVVIVKINTYIRKQLCDEYSNNFKIKE